MRRRRHFLVLSLPSPFYSRVRRLLLSTFSSAGSTGVRQSAASSALVTASGAGGACVLRFRVFRYSFVPAAFVQAGCILESSAMIASAFASAVSAFLPAACIPCFRGSDRIPESGAGSDMRPVCKDQRGPSGRILPGELRRNRFSCYFSNCASARFRRRAGSASSGNSVTIRQPGCLRLGTFAATYRRGSLALPEAFPPGNAVRKKAFNLGGWL